MRSTVNVSLAILLVAGAQFAGAGFPGYESLVGRVNIAAPAALERTENELLHLSYDAPDQEPFTVRLTDPLTVDGDVCRIKFWFARLKGDVDIQLVLEDADGAEYTVDTFTSRLPASLLADGTLERGSRWHLAESIHLRLPENLMERVLPERRDEVRDMTWSLPLQLTAFRIDPADSVRGNDARDDRAAIEEGRGELWLGPIQLKRTDGLHAEYNWYLHDRCRWGWDEPLVIFPDDLTRDAGSHRSRIEIRHGYQGPVVWSADRRVTVAADNAPLHFNERITVPDLPAGGYYIHSNVWDEGGRLIEDRTWYLSVIEGPAKEVEEQAARLEWITGHPHHVFPSGTRRADVRMRLPETALQTWRGTERDVQLTLTVRNWKKEQIYEKTVLAASVPGESIMSFSVPGTLDGHDYTAHFSATDADGNVLERSTLHFGVASPLESVTDRPLAEGILNVRQHLLSKHMMQVGEPKHYVFDREEKRRKETLDLQLIHMQDAFDRWTTDAQRYEFEYAALPVAWAEMEPLPGVFRFHELDRRIRETARKGMKAFITFDVVGSNWHEPKWFHCTPMLNQYGHLVDAYGGSARATRRPLHLRAGRIGPGYEKQFTTYLKRIAAHYRDEPALVGYRMQSLHFPETVAWAGGFEPARTDYAPPARRLWRQWLRQNGRDVIEMPPLLHIPNRPHATVDKRLVDKGVWRRVEEGIGPDISPQWQWFWEFITYAKKRHIRLWMAAIREVDPVRHIQFYRGGRGGAYEAAVPLLRDNGSFHDEGGPFYYQRACESMSLLGGVPYTGECHQYTPFSKAHVDASFFYGNQYDSGWFWLWRWGAIRYHDRRFKHSFPQTMEHIRASRSHFREWTQARADNPQVLVFGSRADKMLGQEKRLFYHMITGIRDFNVLYEYHNMPAHFANEYTDWVDFGAFNVVFVNGEIMTADAVDRVVSAAENGQKIVIIGNAGRYCPERPDERNLLKGALQGMPNVRFIGSREDAPPMDPPVFFARKAFSADTIRETMEWAGVTRPVRATAPEFDCRLRQAGNSTDRYVAVFRKYPSGYTFIWNDDEEIEKKYKEENAWQELVYREWGFSMVSGEFLGYRATDVEVADLPPGRWRVMKIHREPRQVGIYAAEAGRITFETDLATAGELQLFRLEKMGSR